MLLSHYVVVEREALAAYIAPARFAAPRFVRLQVLALIGNIHPAGIWLLR